MRTRYGILLLSTLVLSVAIFISPAHAGGLTVAVYTRTDRASYLPGESGTLAITIRNDGDRAFTLYNITINFPWFSYINGRWEGNQTTENINKGIPEIGEDWYARDVGFTVPSDGRASTSGSGTLIIRTSDGNVQRSFSIIVAIPAYQTGPVGSVLPYLEILLQAATVFLLLLVFFGLRRIPK